MDMTLRRFAACGVLLLMFTGSAAAAELEVIPPHVELRDAFARRQLLVSTAGHDVTHRAAYTSGDPAVVVVDDSGYLTPIANGETTIEIEHEDTRLEVHVTVVGSDEPRPIDFRTEIMPLLSRYGCNSGGCHGKASGQNGFKLSLFGFDVDYDYEAIVNQARGRRVFPGAAERSLLLMKAVGQMPHGGGQRFSADSEAYQLIRQWIASGTQASEADAPTIEQLLIEPHDAVLRPGQSQQLAVVAQYSDGSLRDVTRQAEFQSNLTVVASVDPNGNATAGENSGEAAIMARYMGYVAVFRAIVPHGEPLNEIAGFEPVNYIDRLAAEKWMKLGLEPSPPCDDPTFLRRVTIDVAGRLPTVEETEAFLDDTASDKRARLIDRLLDSPDYAAYFATRWGAILRNSRLAGADQAAYAFHNWLKDLIARNRPYDELVRGVVAAAGEWQDAPAINWYWQSRDDQLHQVTADTAQVFLGVRLQCARCHHHPYERWGQEDYYGLAGFFTRLGRKSFGQPPPYYNAANPTTGEKNPLTNKVPEPKFLDGEYAEFTPEQDPRHALVDWMTQPDNPFFSRVLVNRLWGHFFARGLVNEVDDLRETNPPSNPELLDALADDFRQQGFDMKHMIRTILNSRVYQLSSEPSPKNENDQQNFARYYGRRLISEVFLDAVDQVTGNKTRFNGVAESTRAIDLPHEGFDSYFLDTFDRPARVTSCQCERSSGATLAQVLLLANSDDIENKIAHNDGRIQGMLQAQRSPKEVIVEIYLASLSRQPTAVELEQCLAHVESQEDQRKALEDVMWSLVNCKEFMFNH